MALFRFPSEFDPVSGLMALQRELERAFDNPFGFNVGPAGRGVYPLVNVFSDRDGYVVRVELPGVAPDQLNIEAQGRTLTISGQRQLTPPEGGSFHRRERGMGQFSRSVQLPDDLDLSKAEATHKHGMLTVRVPKREEAKPRSISIKAA